MSDRYGGKRAIDEAARYATDNKAGFQRKRFIKDQPVSVLAAQSCRPVEELIGWIEAGKLRAKRSVTGEWMVWGSELDTWRELLAETRSA